MRNIRMALRFEGKEYVLEEKLIEFDENTTTLEQIASYRKHYDEQQKLFASCLPQ